MKSRSAVVLAPVAVALLAAATWFVLVRSPVRSLEPMTGAPGEPCVIDAAADLHDTMDEPSCTNGSSHCRAACNLGSAGACVEVAYALQRDPAKEGEAYAYFQRGCLLGEPIACTNYAARIWALDHIDAQLTCARRTFERACSAREAYACGMVGRIMLENTEPPAIAPGRRHLESSCRDVGGFPCRVLAKHLESGKLGEYPPGEIGKLLAQACAGGDPDACGEPATAGETFR